MKIARTTSFEIAQPVEVVFPLFSAEGEKLWVPGWDYDNIMGYTEIYENDVFLTHSHDHAGAGAVWIVKRYDPANHCIELYRVEPGDKVGLVAVDCTALNKATTKIEVTYTYIAISEKAKSFLETFTESFYESFIQEWKDLLEDYFERKA